MQPSLRTWAQAVNLTGMRAAGLFLIMLAGQGLSLAGTTEPSFFDRRDYPTTYTECVATGDVNGDGIPDLIGGHYDSGVQVQLGNGDGTFRPGPTTIMANTLTLGPTSMAVLDLNGDGKADLLMGAYVESLPLQYGISVAFGNGDGTFSTSPVFYPAGSAEVLVRLAVGDFNGDHIPDVAILGPAGVSYYQGHSDGTFSSPVLTPLANETSLGSYKLVSGDLNGDGKLDIVAVTSTGYAVLLGNGKGGFSAQECTMPAAPYDMAIGDVNGDGRLDLATVGPYFPDGGNDAYILIGNGDGTFAAGYKVFFPAQEIIRMGDLNNDGIPDLVSGFGYVAYGKGNGKFEHPVLYPIAAPLNTFLGADDVALGVLQKSGNLDIVTANQGGSLSVLLNGGKRGIYDGTYLTMPTGINCGVAGDFNGDGNIDLLMDGVNEDFILFGTGKATPASTRGAPIPVSGECPAVGDLNGRRHSRLRGDGRDRYEQRNSDHISRQWGRNVPSVGCAQCESEPRNGIVGGL